MPSRYVRIDASCAEVVTKFIRKTIVLRLYTPYGHIYTKVHVTLSVFDKILMLSSKG